MWQYKFVLLAFSLFVIATNSCSQANHSAHSSVTAVFVASTPCSQGTKPVPGIPTGTDCELIKWNLTLSGDGSGKTPSIYKLHCVYGLPKQGSTGFIGGGKKVDIEGKWTISKGIAANPDAVVYCLQDDRNNQTICFLKLNDQLLHLLDGGRQLMIGSAAWSYTLNRTGSR